MCQICECWSHSLEHPSLYERCVCAVIRTHVHIRINVRKWSALVRCVTSASVDPLIGSIRKDWRHVWEVCWVIHTHIHTCIHICTHICAYSDVFQVILFKTKECVHAYMHTHIHVCMHTREHEVCVCRYTYAYTYIHACIHARKYVPIPTFLKLFYPKLKIVSICKCMHVHTYMYACIHVHTRWQDRIII